MVAGSESRSSCALWSVSGAFLRELSFAFFIFSLKLAGKFLLAKVAVALFRASDLKVMEAQRVQFLAVLDFQCVRLLYKGNVVVTLLLQARGVLLQFTLALGFAFGGAGRIEEVLDGIHEAGKTGGRLFLFAPQGFSFGPVDGVEALKFFAGLAVERLAELVHFRPLGFDELPALLGLALGEGFSEGLGSDLIGVWGRLGRCVGGFGFLLLMGFLFFGFLLLRLLWWRF